MEYTLWIVNPREKLERWDGLLHATRAYLREEGLLEVQTSNLVPVGAFEASIDTLSVGNEELHTSPEFEMKRVLADTHTSIFQICKSYRDDDPNTGVHLREFTMLEYYRVGATYEKLIVDIQHLVARVTGKEIPFRIVTMAEAVDRATGINIEKDLRRQIESKGTLTLAADDTWDDMFFKLLIEKVEPSFDPAVPTIVKDYPLPLCALAKTNGRVTERFELYWKGMEICNGCTELGSPSELLARYEVESRNRLARGKPPHASPTRLLEALEKGLPPSAGVAVGMDRLFWALYGK